MIRNGILGLTALGGTKNHASGVTDSLHTLEIYQCQEPTSMANEEIMFVMY